MSRHQLIVYLGRALKAFARRGFGAATASEIGGSLLFTPEDKDNLLQATSVSQAAAYPAQVRWQGAVCRACEPGGACARRVARLG